MNSFSLKIDKFYVFFYFVVVVTDLCNFPNYLILCWIFCFAKDFVGDSNECTQRGEGNAWANLVVIIYERKCPAFYRAKSILHRPPPSGPSPTQLGFKWYFCKAFCHIYAIWIWPNTPHPLPKGATSLGWNQCVALHLVFCKFSTKNVLFIAFQ